MPKGIYARIAPRSRLASKNGIAIKEGVIGSDYTGEVKVIIVNHGKNDCRIQPGNRMAQLIMEKIDTSDMMEVDDLEKTERAERRCGSTDMSPKRTRPVTDWKQMISFVKANHEDNEYFDVEDMGRHLRLRKEHILMSSAIISQVEGNKLEGNFITKVWAASKNDHIWQEKRAE